MAEAQQMENDFIKKITLIIEDNISNEQFGVSELARETGMSRSNLLRKVKKLTDLSVSQFIRQVRLVCAMEILKQASSNVSEVSYQVGFNSTSYFIKCFRDHYGYPPGEVNKRGVADKDSKQSGQRNQSHHLAAIMFTDIEGYTALMQRDEEKAIEYRNRHREVFNTITAKFNGNILQYFGDGTLSTFDSAIDAVRCGIELQLAFLKKPRIPVRVGIHSGDIIFRDDGIVGDGVNVASRIESLAIAGSVFISEKVYDEVKNQQGIQTASMGLFELKNVGKPVEVFAVTNKGLEVPSGNQIAGRVKSETENTEKDSLSKRNKSSIKWLLIILAAIITGMVIYNSNLFNKWQENFSVDQTKSKESIAVLPFINDSNDSTNVYIINGLMESVLNNLQNIEDLRVISRTSVERYRGTNKLVTEIAEELDVKYLVEGSGQKIGDQILLNIQLIDASTDSHLWAEQYDREVTDIFNLQKEIARKIADKIEVIITPEEAKRINKSPTDDLVAYDYFLKGLDLMYSGKPENLHEGIGWFEKAIEQDNEFARAYAGVAISYYFLDVMQAEKQYADQINHYSDQALLLDPKLPQSLIAKALFYMNSGENEMAVPYLEKALEYNPNSALVINILSDFYTRYIPNTEKYLEYALKGVQLDITAHDSVTASFIYLHLSNAFVQTGFVEEAEYYVDRSLSYSPGNLYSEYVKAFILYAKNEDLSQTKELLLTAFSKDTNRLDIMQEIGKTYYFMRDYENAYAYFKKFLAIKEALNLDIYPGENAKIAVVYANMGLKDESERYLQEFKDFSENDKSIYKYLSLSAYYSYQGDKEKAIEQLKLFSQQDNYHYWIILFLGIDPLMDNIKDLPEYDKVFDDIESKFWKKHKMIRASLVEKGLL